MEHDTGKLGGANNNMDADLDVGGLDGANKTIDTEYNISGANNIPDANGTNNVKKEAKVCESNLFWLLLITIRVKKYDWKAISPKYYFPRHRLLFEVLYLLTRTTITW